MEFIKQKGRSFPFGDEIMNLYQNVTGVALKVVNPDVDGDLTNHVFCEVLSRATHACADFSANNKNNFSRSRLNPSQELWFDTLIVEAKNQGLIKEGMSRYDAFKFTAKQFAANKELVVKSSSLICPSSELYRDIIRESLRRGKAMFPIELHDALERKERQLFEEQKNKYCHINASEVLQDDNWRSLFLSFLR